MKYKVLVFLFLIFILAQWYANAQTNGDNVLNIGGINKNTGNIKLEDAQLSVLYQYKHGFVQNGDISFVIDTMALAVGSRFSIFYDWNEQNRREAFSSYFRKDGSPIAFISVSYNDFIDKAVDNNKLFTPSISGETYQLYKDRKKNHVTVMDFDNSNFEVEELFFFYEESLSPLDWVIKEDTTSVLDYTCRKATCDFEGRSYFAWFTSDIPVNDGPYKFFGLPGMILKIEDSENLFQFEAIGLEKVENLKIVIDEKSNYLKCTKEEYKQLKIRQQNNNTLFYRIGEILYFSNRRNSIEYIPIEKYSHYAK